MNNWVYSDIVKDHFLNPRNFLMGDESKFDYNAKGIVGNPICGDQMLMFLKIEPPTSSKSSNPAKGSQAQNPKAAKNSQSAKNPKTTNFGDYIIKDIKWKTYGCASAIASTSALSELAIGKSLDAALQITAEDIEQYLGGLPKHKFHCSVLGHEALAAAIQNYRQTHKPSKTTKPRARKTKPQTPQKTPNQML